jgi:hypothetical protein
MSTSEKLEEINRILNESLDKDDVDLIDAIYEILKRI